MTSGLLAAAAFFLMLSPPIQLPSVPGLPGLPLFYVPALVWVAVTLLLTRLRMSKTAEEQLGRIVAAGLSVVCVALVWSSLASPTHRACVEPDGEECGRYEVEAGPDIQGAFMWGVGATLLIMLAGPGTVEKVRQPRREIDDASDE